MTDNRTTELLCKLLEERGIEWSHGDAAYEIEWSTPDGRYCSAMYWKPTFTVLVSGCTPEQAIAATMGSDTCSMEYGGDVTESTKRVLGVYFCSECGSPTYNDCMPYYCMYCGKAVKR